MPNSNLISIIIFATLCLFLWDGPSLNTRVHGPFKQKTLVIQQENGKDLGHWLCGCNLLKMSSKEAKDLITSSSNKAQVSSDLTDHMKKLNRLDEMHPDTVGEIFKHHPNKDEHVDWANERYEFDFSVLEWRIKSIKKL